MKTKKSTVVYFVIVIIFLGGLLALFPNSKSAPPPDSILEQRSSAGEVALRETGITPSVLFKDADGKDIDISKQQGKVLFINFWATWCPPCIQEMPSINALRRHFSGKDIQFFMVDVDANFSRSEKFMRRNRYDLPVYIPAGEIPPEFLSGSIPTTVIIDKGGKVFGKHVGTADYMDPGIINLLDSLVNQ
ncbi:MAG TPA: TlpA disulfide reductase family protein [Flavitalea sp.]|nr:TlpA disulfide reductase family protein [Flavitalea sp.]